MQDAKMYQKTNLKHVLPCFLQSMAAMELMPATADPLSKTSFSSHRGDSFVAHNTNTVKQPDRQPADL